MIYNVIAHSVFKRQFKRLLKKYPSLKNEISNLISSLEEHPQQGVAIGNDCFKIRLAIKSKGKGKNGGARIITHMIFADDTVLLLTIYDKAEQENISEALIDDLLKYL